MLIIKIQGILWDFSMMRLCYKLTKRTTKTEKPEKSLKIVKMNKIVNFKTIRSKLTSSSNIIHSTLINKLMGPVSFFAT